MLTARILRATGRGPEALAVAERALALDPTRDETYRLGCALLIDLGRTTDALNAARHAVRIDPEFAWNHYLLVQALVANNDMDAAAESAERVRALDPQSPLGWDAIGFVASAPKTGRRRRRRTAARCDPRPATPRRIHNLGTMLLRQGRAVEASDHFIQGGKVDAADSEFLHSTYRAAVLQLLFGRFMRTAVRLDAAERRHAGPRKKDSARAPASCSSSSSSRS